ncbi:MAG: ATP-binding cassette domain-containing protein [Coprococcus sp.]|nr:ATP-binding cassette domain-containing protein [Coprococcus sp.]
MALIDIKRLSHKFNIKDSDGNIIGEHFAVRDADITAQKGSIIAIMGRNGSGKSTLARHMNGLLSAHEGSVIIAGKDAADKEKLLEIRKTVGMVFQNPDNQIVGNSVAEDVGFGLENIGMETETIWKEIHTALELTGMSAYIDRNTSRLSGGQKQRLAIASVMAMKPECIVFDEATSMLDPAAASDILKLVIRLNREQHITVILITHKMKEALYADCIYVMSEGSVKLQGKPQMLLMEKAEELRNCGIEIPFIYKLENELTVLYEAVMRDKIGKTDKTDRIDKTDRTDKTDKALKPIQTDKAEIKDTDEGCLITDIDRASDRLANSIKACIGAGKLPEQKRKAVIDDRKSGRYSNVEKTDSEILIQAENISYTYHRGDTPVYAVKNVSFSIRRGEIVAIAGHTGSGKSTLLQMMNGLIRPASGKLTVSGIDVVNTKNLKALRRKIGFVFQYPEYQLFEDTVLKDVMYGPKNFGMDREQAELSAIDALRLTGIDEKYFEASPFELSGGQRKRVALAGIFAYKPEILILDEPVAGLDSEGKEMLFQCINDFKNRENATVIWVSHDMNDVYEVADRLIVMREGSISFDGGLAPAFANESFVKENKLELPEMYVFKEKMKPELTICSNKYQAVVEEIKSYFQ